MMMLTALLKRWISLLLRLNITGLENLEFSRPAIMMPNHLSLLDALVLALYLPKDVAFVVNTDIARKLGFVRKLRRMVTVDPLNPYSVRHMVKIVQSGVPLLLFPEGRITRTGGQMKIYNGVGYIAMKTGAALYPIAIDGLEFSKLSYLGGKVRRVAFPQTSIAIGDPFTVPYEHGLPMKKQKEQAAQRIGRKLQEQLLACRIGKPAINLFHEVRMAAKRAGWSFTVCEDLTAKVTYRKLLISAYTLARKFEPYLRADKTAALLMPNSIAHVAALLALMRLGKVPAILNFSAGKQALTDACETAGVRTVFTSRQFVEKAFLQPIIDELGKQATIVYLEDIRSRIGFADKAGGLLDFIAGREPDLDPSNDAEVVLFTSGSESKPKGVVLSHANLFANVQQARSVIAFTSQDVVFNAMPMFHSFGLTAGTLLPLLSGMKTILYPSPLHYKIIPELVYDKNATILFGTSTFLAGYGKAAHPYDFYSLRYVIAGAERLKDDVRELWADKFGIRILEGYGTTEASPVLSLCTPLAYRRGTVGKLLPGVSYRLEPVPGIEEGGNLFVQGPNMMKGYLIHGQGFVPCPEWYDCGDIVSIDGDGFITIKSRLKRFAKIGGEMISLNAVEETAVNCFGNGQLAAVNVPDERKGERIILFAAFEGCDPARLKSYLSQNGSSPLMMPSAVVQLDKLPLLGSGKTDYVTLKRRAAEQLSARSGRP